MALSGVLDNISSDMHAVPTESIHPERNTDSGIRDLLSSDGSLTAILVSVFRCFPLLLVIFLSGCSVPTYYTGNFNRASDDTDFFSVDPGLLPSRDIPYAFDLKVTLPSNNLSVSQLPVIGLYDSPRSTAPYARTQLRFYDHPVISDLIFSHSFPVPNLWLKGLSSLNSGFLACVHSYSFPVFAVDGISRILFSIQSFVLFFFYRRVSDGKTLDLSLLILSSAFSPRPLDLVWLLTNDAIWTYAGNILYLLWVSGLFSLVFSIVKSTANPDVVGLLSRRWREMALFAFAIFVAESWFRFFALVNSFLFGALSVFLVLFYSALLKTNRSHLVASTGTCDILLICIFVSFLSFSNSFLHVVSKEAKFCLAGDLIERSFVALAVYFISRLGKMNQTSGYVQAEKAMEIGSIEDEGVQDAVIDYLFPTDGDSNQANSEPKFGDFQDLADHQGGIEDVTFSEFI
jgi:hypothetical protein